MADINETPEATEEGALAPAPSLLNDLQIGPLAEELEKYRVLFHVDQPVAPLSVAEAAWAARILLVLALALLQAHDDMQGAISEVDQRIERGEMDAGYDTTGALQREYAAGAESYRVTLNLILGMLGGLPR
jgi:hypothetical protein